MSNPSLPNGAKPLPPVGSDPGPNVVLVKAGQPVLESQGNTIKVIAERLLIEKRTVEGEGVRVRIVMDEEETPASVTLRAERIEVEHVPIGRMVERAPPVREENGVTIIPVMEEVVVTETRLVLKEELHIRRVAETREHQQTVLLRRQRAEVERLPATGKPITDTKAPTPTEEDPR